MNHKLVSHIPRVAPPEGQPAPAEWRAKGYPCKACGVIPRYEARAWGDAWFCDQCGIYQFSSIGD